jgi:DNA helicase II / ATP-dependent DNA helicase PcrA
VSVDLPRSLSATTALRLRTDPDQLAADLARPMPRQPSRAARFGSRFHAWVESRFGQQQLLDPEELPGRADSGIDDDADLRALVAAFLAGPYADVQPLAVEAPFQLVLAGTVVRGRIDAVYERPDGGFDVVDWKTSRRADADPTQLALYRLAWAELSGVPLESVVAAFYYVRTASVVRPNDLPDREQLTEMLFGVAG